MGTWARQAADGGAATTAPHWRATRRGQALVEFTLILPVLLLVVLGVVDVGRVFSSYEATANAAREGARYCALKQTTPSTLAERISGGTGELGPMSGVTVTPSASPAVAKGDPVTIHVS